MKTGPERQHLTIDSARLQPVQDGDNDSFLTADDRLVWAVVVRYHDSIQFINDLGGQFRPAPECGEHQLGNLECRWIK